MDFITGFFIGAFAPFFALGWIWMAAIVAFIIAETVCVRNDNWFFSTALLIGGVLGIFFLGTPPDGQTWLSFTSALLSVMWLVIYAGSGIVWSLFFGVFVKGGKANKEFDRRKAKILEQYPEGDQRDKELKRLKEWLRERAPNKSKFLGYFFFWPFSVLGWIIGDFLGDILEGLWNVMKRFGTAVWNAMSGFFAAAWKRRIGNRLDD